MAHTAEHPTPVDPPAQQSSVAPARAQPASPPTPTKTPATAPSPVPAPAPAGPQPAPSGNGGGVLPQSKRPSWLPRYERAARGVEREPRRAARRTRVVVRKVGPLSVLKFSLIFYFCVFLIVFLALLIIYLILSAAGAIDSLAKILGYVFGTGDTGTHDPEPIKINGQVVFTWLFIGGMVLTVVWSVINVFIAFLYNLISDIIGGVEVTLAEKSQR
jgi:Transmembrane domain of unknown function (DUF3566)